MAGHSGYGKSFDFTVGNFCLHSQFMGITTQTGTEDDRRLRLKICLFANIIFLLSYLQDNSFSRDVPKVPAGIST